jgi:flavin reductase (DIM6/NTAB) family NADH-FMN oxidoreductase RutF
MSDLPIELINKVTWKIPNALCLVGSRSGDEWNGMTQSWVTQVSMEPVLIAIAVDKNAVTNRLVAASGVFTVNLWSAADTRPFVKFSKPATKEGMTLNERPIREGETGAPVFEEAAAYLECRVQETLDVGTHSLFLGEVVAAGINDDEAEIASMSHTRMKYGGVKRH